MASKVASKAKPKSARLLPWFGSNTENAAEVGRLLEGCRFVAIPFAGGMSEVPFITAKQILANDLHKNVIGLCRVIANDEQRAELIPDCRWPALSSRYSQARAGPCGVGRRQFRDCGGILRRCLDEPWRQGRDH